MGETVTQLVPGPVLRAVTAEVVSGADAGRVAIAGGETLTIGTADGNDLVLRDPAVSRFHLELAAARGGVRILDHDSTNGTWIGALRIGDVLAPPGTLLRIGDSTVRVAESAEAAPRGELLAGEELAGMIGRSSAMRRLMGQVAQLAGSTASVLVVGESGTGKELVARALHELGPRASGPLVTVDCGALSPALVASELFGHERGAFTGADQARAGAFEEAHGGTVFLDEIGELPEALQAVLLGVLERRRFRRVGGRRDIDVDVRLVCATHRDLRAEVNARRFRLDLYYRLAVVTLRIPPLRERREDVVPLVGHFLRECGWDRPIGELFSADALRGLEQHHFAGNVRELRNFVEAAIAMGSPPALAEAPAGAVQGGLEVRHDLPFKDARAAIDAEFERSYLTQLMERTGGNASAAARQACMTRSHLLELLDRHGLRVTGK